MSSMFLSSGKKSRLARFLVFVSLLALLLTAITVALAAPGGVVTSPQSSTAAPRLPAAPEAALASLKTVPMWNELEQMLDDPNNLNPARRASYLPDPLPPLLVHPLDSNPLTGEPLTLDPDTGEISREIPAYGVPAVNGSGQLVDVNGAPVTSLPKPVNENDFIIDREAATVLGKALFWDMQVGSDGVQACGTCHFDSGIDTRTKNTLNPGLQGGDLTLEVAGPNEQLINSDFPFHKLDDVTVPGEPLFNPANSYQDSHDVVGSMGITYRTFVDVPVGPSAFAAPDASGVSALLPDLGTADPDPIAVFQGVRRVTGRNTPSMEATSFLYDNFWDGRAREEFNGGSIIGAADPFYYVFANDGTATGPVAPVEDPHNPDTPIRIRMSSLASQAMGPPLNDMEMSFSGRNWPKIGKKLLQAGVVPMANQLVATDDSVLGPYSNQGGSQCAVLGRPTAPDKPGLCLSYNELIASAFKPEYLASTSTHFTGAADPSDDFDSFSLIMAAGGAEPLDSNQFTQMEANFSLFFGLGVQLYQQLLVPDDTPFDRFMEANPGAALAAAAPGQPIPPQPGVTLVPGFDYQALVGLDFFQNSNLSGRNPQFKGDGCVLCHGGPEMSSHALSAAFGLNLPPRTPVDQDPNVPLPGSPNRIISGYMLADELGGPAPGAIEFENVNFIGNVLEPGTVNAFLDEGMYNIAVSPVASDLGLGADGLFGWPLSRTEMALKNLGGNAGAPCPDAVNCSTEPGLPLANFDPDLGPAGLSEQSRGGGLFGPTPAYQRWLDSGGATGPLNPGLSPEPLNPLLPDYLAPWTANLPVGEAHPQTGELIVSPNTLTSPPTIPPAPNQDCIFGVANTYPGGPAGFGPNCANLVSGAPNDAAKALTGTWPEVNRVAGMGSMKVPMLRNVELTAPYFHNGSVLTLRQVVDFYGRGGDYPKTNEAHLDPAMNSVGGTPELVNFMLALTDDRSKYERAPFDHPEMFKPVDGTSPDNTGGRPFLLANSGPGGTFEYHPPLGAGGSPDASLNFLNISSTPVPGPNNDQFDGAGSIRYFWNYYDSQIMRSWLIMGNPSTATDNLEFGLSIGNSPMGLADMGYGPGVVQPGDALPYINPGLAGGPAVASSRTQMPAITSQRSLMGDSFEEVPGAEMVKQSKHFYWSWYDMQSAGYKNWIVVNNPDIQSPVIYEIRIGGVVRQSGTIPAGGLIDATFPGVIGGPVEVITGAPVMATQRVLSGYDTAFNEVPGIPQEELSGHYHWTWYDMQSPGFRNWILLANADPLKSASYEIRIGGQLKQSGILAPGQIVTPMFPGTMAGPVEVTTSPIGGGNSTVIATQRVTAGPSFEEVPGYRQESMSREYAWTWYDMTSGFADWVLVSNPQPFTVTYQIRLDGAPISLGTIPAGGMVTPTFPGRMGGPVEVSASHNVLVSQRVTRNGHFNEVLGQLPVAGP